MYQTHKENIMIDWKQQQEIKKPELRFKKKNDWIMWFLTALAVAAVINAIIEVSNTW